MTRRFAQTVAGKLVLSLATYVAIYVSLSAFGAYRLKISGERRYAGIGLGLMDTDYWYPAGIEWRRWKDVSGKYRIDANPLGWFFLPLIFVDRQLVHPNRQIPE